jgi:hypothetical protein
MFVVGGGGQGGCYMFTGLAIGYRTIYFNQHIQMRNRFCNCSREFEFSSES